MSQDVHCPKCGDPCEIDYFHDVADDNGTTFRKVQQDFALRGCVAIDMACNPKGDTFKGMVSSAMFDLMGDDVDGVAAMMDDFEYMGMLND